MKKRLEAELISIAHRILKLKNKSEVDQLYKETQKLYETLSVLKFYQDNFETVKTDVDAAILDEKLEQHLEEETPQTIVLEVPAPAEEPVAEVAEEPIAESKSEPEEEVMAEPEAEEEVEEAIVPEAVEEVVETVEEEPAAEETSEEEVIETAATEIEAPLFTPIFELEAEEEEETAKEEVEPAETASEMTPETPKVKVEDFLSDDFKDPVFVKPNEVTLFQAETTEEEKPKASFSSESNTKSIAIGLNDRIGFVKHLFDDSNEDFNRVLSQLNTFDSFEEAKNFIDDMVKPDYNNWQGEEDFAERFMELIENKFQ